MLFLLGMRWGLWQMQDARCTLYIPHQFGAGGLVQPCLQGCQTPDLMCGMWDHLEKAGLPYFTRARSPGLRVDISNPHLAPGDPGIQTASHTGLVTLATHLSLERWPVQIALHQQAFGAVCIPKELALVFLVWGQYSRQEDLFKMPTLAKDPVMCSLNHSLDSCL